MALQKVVQSLVLLLLDTFFNNHKCMMILIYEYCNMELLMLSCTRRLIRGSGQSLVKGFSVPVEEVQASQRVHVGII